MSDRIRENMKLVYLQPVHPPGSGFWNGGGFLHGTRNAAQDVDFFLAQLGAVEQLLQALESQQLESRAQIDLFAAPPLPAAEPEPVPSAIEHELARLDPDAMTPREALDALYALKGLLP